MAPAIAGPFLFRHPLGTADQKAHVERNMENVMPLPTFLALITTVILTAGLSIVLVHWAGVPIGVAALAAMALALLVKARAWL